jgi:hypothetical protein
MHILPLVLYIFAFVFFILYGFKVPEPARFSLLGLGLACLTGALALTQQGF